MAYILETISILPQIPAIVVNGLVRDSTDSKEAHGLVHAVSANSCMVRVLFETKYWCLFDSVGTAPAALMLSKHSPCYWTHAFGVLSL